MSEQRRPSRQPQVDNDINIDSHAWLSASPPPSPIRSGSPEPWQGHAGALPNKRAHFEQVRDMWKDLGNKRERSDYLSEQLLRQVKVNEDLSYKD
ncbi:hypothetical protein PTT_06696 [Pyrenophora teres f. teres 0-1]|uniref:Uncharacterized protein n=1 Tax=Pyrenophora teres f. teres (strain 0-1) TaxID=861557 RepID=E3RG07_PYRTT|nr:hypothetical protein PTT_16207 [Pyrenophora teres f. teres 0-1]EFQ95342.1 hypothetical protein PTT_06696 [Pyrenophora teres f. teres 0-1]